MAKHLIALIASLSLSLFVVSCAPPRVEPIEPNGKQPPEIKSAEPEPNELEPLTPLVPKVEVPPAEPNELEPSTAPLPEVELPTAEPNELELSTMNSLEPEPNEATPIKAEPPKTEPTPVEPNEVEPEAVKPDATKPEIIEPNAVEHSPAATERAEPNQVQPTPPEPNEAETLPKVSFHEKCAEVLSEFVDEAGMVDYGKLRRQRLQLKKLLDEFDELDRNEYKSWPRDDKIAFWINAYNTQMLNIIAKNYPIQSSPFVRIIWGPYSILHIKGIWTDYKFIVMDEEFPLSAIEQRFFRKEFDEPRVFLALTRASLSSPPMRNEPYYGYKLREQLDDQAKRFLSSGYGFKIDRDKQEVYLSAIFEPKQTWYGREFVAKYGTDKKFKDQPETTRAVLNFITNYIPGGDVSFLEVENYSVKYMKYDWTLNDSSRKQ